MLLSRGLNAWFFLLPSKRLQIRGGTMKKNYGILPEQAISKFCASYCSALYYPPSTIPIECTCIFSVAKQELILAFSTLLNQSRNSYKFRTATIAGHNHFGKSKFGGPCDLRRPCSALLCILHYSSSFFPLTS